MLSTVRILVHGRDVHKRLSASTGVRVKAAETLRVRIQPYPTRPRTDNIALVLILEHPPLYRVTCPSATAMQPDIHAIHTHTDVQTYKEKRASRTRNSYKMRRTGSRQTRLFSLTPSRVRFKDGKVRPYDQELFIVGSVQGLGERCSAGESGLTVYRVQSCLLCSYYWVVPQLWPPVLCLAETVYTLMSLYLRVSPCLSFVLSLKACFFPRFRLSTDRPGVLSPSCTLTHRYRMGLICIDCLTTCKEHCVNMLFFLNSLRVQWL